MSDLKCEVCEKDALGVAACSVGPASFGYCKECLEQGAEPLHIMVFIVQDLGPNGVASWVKGLRSYNEGQYIEWDEICEYAKKNTD